MLPLPRKPLCWRTILGVGLEGRLDWIWGRVTGTANGQITLTVDGNSTANIAGGNTVGINKAIFNNLGTVNLSGPNAQSSGTFHMATGAVFNNGSANTATNAEFNILDGSGIQGVSDPRNPDVPAGYFNNYKSNRAVSFQKMAPTNSIISNIIFNDWTGSFKKGNQPFPGIIFDKGTSGKLNVRPGAQIDVDGEAIVINEPVLSKVITFRGRLGL